MTFAGTPAVRDLSGAWYAVMGIDRDAPPQYRTPTEFARAPADEAWVYSCVNKIASNVAGVPLRVYAKHGRRLVSLDDEPSPEGQDLQDLLDYVNPVDMTGNQLKYYSAAAYAVWGENYLGKVRGRLGGYPQELYWLAATDITPKSQNGRSVTAYEYVPSGGQGAGAQVYEPRDMVPFRRPNLVNPLRGLSPLSSVGSEISTGRMWAERIAAMVANDAIPPGFFSIPKDAEFTKQDESLVRRTLRLLRGPRNKGKSAILPQGIDWKTIALTPQAQEMIANRKASRMGICAALGMPLVLAGDDDKNTVYGNLRDAERILWRGTLIPDYLDPFADTLNNWLVPDFDPGRRKLTVAFDYSEIEALKPTWDVEWNAWIAGIYAQAVVPNQFIRHFRLGPDVPWGDKPVPRTAVALRPDPAVVPDGAVPTLDPANEADLPESGAGLTGDGDDISAALRAYGKSLYRHPAVRAWTSAPHEPLAVHELFGGRYVSTPVRMSIEAGLRRRDSAAAIAASLEVTE